MVCYKNTKFCRMCKYWFCYYCDIRWYDPYYSHPSKYICKDCFEYTYIIQS